jgi:hypothetical protein
MVKDRLKKAIASNNHQHAHLNTALFPCIALDAFDTFLALLSTIYAATGRPQLANEYELKGKEYESKSK